MRLLIGGFGLLPALLAAQISTPATVATARAPISLSWRRFDVDLTGPARPWGYVSAIGRRAALLGNEVGSLEAWVWPLKLLHGFELAFKTPLYDQPIPGRDIARTVTISPAGATIVYTHSAFTVTERLFAPLDQPAIVAVLEVDAVRPIEIIARFRADLQLAWPGGFGGQYVFWDDAERAFVLSESRRQVNGFFGSPWATWATNNPSHMLADAPSELHIAVGDQGPVPMPRPGEPAGRLTAVHASGIPIVMVGAIAPRDSVRATYHAVLGNVAALYAERAAHAQAVLDSTVQLTSPDAELDLAVQWASLNLDEAMTCNPDLGCGLVAGFGPSGATSTRPGFGWYFGGDASINSLAMSSVGLWSVARDGLAFFAGFQGSRSPNIGKIPHEISQSAKRINWFEDFPYAFYHGDTTPFWILALAEYWRASGDSATLRRLWPNLKRAYQWSKATDADGDGLMDNARAGAGAIEVGDLQQGLVSDIYMSSVWVKALEVFPRLADAMGDRSTRDDARRLHGRALASLRERLWLPTRPPLRVRAAGLGGPVERAHRMAGNGTRVWRCSTRSAARRRRRPWPMPASPPTGARALSRRARRCSTRSTTTMARCGRSSPGSTPGDCTAITMPPWASRRPGRWRARRSAGDWAPTPRCSRVRPTSRSRRPCRSSSSRRRCCSPRWSVA